MATQPDQKIECTACDRVADMPRPHAGTIEEAARVVGWRIGTNARGPVAYCPECTGYDEGYWDRQTLAVAYMAGIDAGNTAWT